MTRKHVTAEFDDFWDTAHKMAWDTVQKKVLESQVKVLSDRVERLAKELAIAKDQLARLNQHLSNDET